MRHLILAICFCTALGLGTAAAAQLVRVVVLPVVVHSSNADSAYLSEGLSDTLSARLEQAGGIRVVPLEADVAATSKLRPALEVARSVDAEFVVFGSFTQFGEGASLDLRAARVGDVDEEGLPKSRKVFIQSGTVSAIIPRLDDVAGRILQYIGSKGVATAPPAVSDANAATADSSLEQRIEALERAVFPKQAADSTVPKTPIAD